MPKPKVFPITAASTTADVARTAEPHYAGLWSEYMGKEQLITQEIVDAAAAVAARATD